ncbi:MAG: HPr family phosphocarrier protein [Eubacteriaceae bacterium]|jgi:phosphocarrier protein|nr:HPr family phosphocarrier protein [Eubacteriaceae bacterium]
MKEFSFTITDPIGIHARPAGLLVKFLHGFASKITIVKGDKKADPKSMLSLMGLAAKCGETLTVQLEGDQAEAEAEKLEAYMKENF